ncbi:MAG: OmpA family protein [bacterium]
MKIFFKIVIFWLLFTWLSKSQLFSEDSATYSEIFAVHPKIGVGFNFYNSVLVKFENSVDCGLFESGSGLAYSGALYFERKISDYFHIGLGAMYIDRSGVFTLESTIPSREIDATDIEWVKTENRLEPNISFLEFNPELRFTIKDDFINGPLRLAGGFRFGFPVTKTFNQKEIILSPGNAKFISTNSNERLIAEGDITTIQSLHYGLSVGIENMLKIGVYNYFTQQIIFDYNFNNICTDVQWNLYSIRLDLGFRFGVIEKKEIIAPEPEIEKPVIETHEIVKKDTVILEPKLALEFVDEKPDLQILTGNEILATLPLVNAVFFPVNSSELPIDYIKKDTILPSQFYGSAVENRKYILLRMADLVKKNPNAKITVQGATSGPENESLGIELAKQRAENVKQTLVHLGIPDSIITTNFTLLPTYPSNQDYPEGKLENQRADIFIQNAPLQEYVGFQKYAEVSGNVKIKITHENLRELNEVILEPFFYDTLIICSQPGIYIIPVKQRINMESDSFQLSAELSYRNIIKETKKALSKNNFELIEKELLLKNFNAVLRFDYNSSELSQENKELLNQLVRKIPENATIVINGSADALGSEQQNIQLAMQRAKAAEDYINQITQSAFTIITDNKFLKHSEKTAEGRFFNRAISIRIQ